MKEETKDTIACILIFAIPVILLVSFAVYMFFHPKIRGISYCDDNRYYMVNAITGNNESSPDSWHFGAIKKRIMIRGRMEQQLQFGLLVRETKIEVGDLDAI